MKELKENTIKIVDDVLNELNKTLKKFNLGDDVYLESFKLTKGNYQLNNCRRVCQYQTDPKTGQKKLVCKIICP
jgi:hypothetical protein